MDFRIGPFNPWGVSNALPQGNPQGGGVQGSIGPWNPAGLVNGWGDWQIPTGSFQDRNRQALGMPAMPPQAPMPPANIPGAQGAAPPYVAPPPGARAPNGMPMGQPQQLTLEHFLPEILAMIGGDPRYGMGDGSPARPMPADPNSLVNYGPGGYHQTQAPHAPSATDLVDYSQSYRGATPAPERPQYAGASQTFPLQSHQPMASQQFPLTPQAPQPAAKPRESTSGAGMYRHRQTPAPQASQGRAPSAGWSIYDNPGDVPDNWTPSPALAAPLAVGAPIPVPAPRGATPPMHPRGEPAPVVMSPTDTILAALFQGNSGARSRATQGQGGSLNRRIGSRDK